MSLRRANEMWMRRAVAPGRGLFGLVLPGLALFVALSAWGQYPGMVKKDTKDAPELRSVAVLEWTGDEAKPKASRLVPVAVFDAGKLQDGGIYLARPEPLAVAPMVEYELQEDGKPVGLFDVHNAGQQAGGWIGLGSWRPLPRPKPKPSARELAKTKIDDDVQSDAPVLHRKHHADEGSGNGSGSGTGSSGSDAPAADPDRPTLHKKSTSDSSGSGSSGDTGSSGTDSNAPSDPDRPVLHKKTAGDDASGGDSGSATASSDPDRPVLHKAKQAKAAESEDSELAETDPDRPRLKRGKSAGVAVEILPSLMGLPPDIHQEVAVSDAKSRPEHLWTYSWASPDDEAKMKSALEDVARTALGLNTPAPAATPKKTAAKTATTKTATTGTARKTAKPAAAPPPPAPLVDEEFRVFELAYGSGATLVLTAHTDGPAAQQKFVTLVAQPDLYGNVLTLLKNVTDGGHLDETPRMRLIDAVDAMADNRGELLFELRGASGRQFALYRVLRGQAEKLFVTGGGDFGAESAN